MGESGVCVAAGLENMIDEWRRLKQLAVDLANEAGALAAHLQPGATVSHVKTSPTDTVTTGDLAVQDLIVDRLRTLRPDDGLHAEESREKVAGSTGYTWVVDPIDGTVNYLYGSDYWAVSIAVEHEDDAVVGVVFRPSTGELFETVVGEGSFLNGRRLACRDQYDLSQALVATGFSYHAMRRSDQGVVVAGLLGSVRDIRRCGAGALDICQVASGRVDGYFETGLAPWDWRAAALIAEEAGARVETVTGGGGAHPLTIAAGPRLFEELRAAVVHP